MKKIFTLILLTLSVIHLTAQELSVPDILKQIPGVRVEKIEEKLYNKNFKEGYLVWVKQPVDHNRPDGPSFEQRVWLCHNDINKQVVLVTEGYTANRFYTDDLTKILKCNQIFVEHRYFGKSVPENKDWKYLTVKQAAADHHRINQIFKQLYSNDWLSTGISKGGTTTMLYKRFYPNDIKVWVPIVGPMNVAREDERLSNFFNEVSTPEVRAKVLAFQRNVLKNRKQIYPMFLNEIEKKKYHFNFNKEKVFECCVLEFEFAFFQWGTHPDSIPETDAKAENLFRFLNKVASPDYFAKEGMASIFPFFVQAYTELGYYGYRTDSLKNYLRKVKGFQSSYDLFIPRKMKLKFDDKVLKDNYDSLQLNNNNMIIVVGGIDPWGATSFVPSGNTNSLYVKKEGGSHTTRILNLPPEQKEMVLQRLENWLNVSINRNDSVFIKNK